MINNKCKRIAIVSFVLTGLLTACSTPSQVRDLAGKTAANIGIISVHLRRLAQNSQNVAGRRASNIARLQAANDDLRARYLYDVELVRMSGDGQNIKLIEKIANWSKKVDTIFEKAKGDNSEKKKQMLANQKKLDTKSKILSEIAQTLASMAKEDSFKERIDFLKEYGKELKDELDKALEADNENTKAAKDLLEKITKRMKKKVAETKSSLKINL